MTMTKTNAERAERAEKALIAFIEATGDSLKANEVDTWIGDLLCDLRHFAKFMRIEFNPNAGEINFHAECSEDPKGHFEPSVDWLRPKPPTPFERIMARAAVMAHEMKRADFSANLLDKKLKAVQGTLRMADLSKANDFNFAHDVFGIYDNYIMSASVYRNSWTPRYGVHAPQEKTKTSRTGQDARARRRSNMLARLAK